MLKKRQQQNMMGGGGNDYGVGTTAPSGPMGARQSGNGMSGVRNFLNDPFVNIFAAATPFRAPFAVAKLGVSAYDGLQANQNPYADDSMDRLSFNAPSPVAPQSSFAGEALAPMAPVAVSSPVYQSSVTADNSYGGFGDATGGSDTMGFAGEYAHGGMVHAEHLKGRAPAPDDGYGALQGGEYVITKAAVEKYGKRLLDAINNGTFR
jgi:hypothetical protein